MDRFKHSGTPADTTILSRRRALQLGGAALALGGASAISGTQGALALGASSPSPSADLVYASSFGYDPDDATDALQAALDSSAHTVVIDDVGSEWLTRPLFLNRDNICIVVEPGVTVRAKPGGFPGTSDKLLNITGRQNVTLLGYAATFAMNKQEYIDLNDGSQWRPAIYIGSCSNIRIEGLKITGAGGDGIYLGRVRGANQAQHPPHSTNVTIRNVTCDDNYRNGLSVVSVDGLLVEGSAFINSRGQNPQAGIDFEPNLSDEQISRAVVRDTVMDRNVNANLYIVLRHPSEYAAPIDLLVDRVYIGRQHETSTYAVSLMIQTPSGVDPGGRIELRDSLIESNPASCSTLIGGKQASGVDLVFTRTVAINMGNESSHYPPIYLTGLSGVSEFGGISWDDCSMFVDQPVAFLRANAPEGSPVIRDLAGNITVVNPHGVWTDLGDNTEDITLAVRALE
ncbi:right-handed parallel beta-helix repeat-containing protein, partial [Phytoactinopolyspora endophytica]|uniref:right-handed parallel beta-helix repeat-containing protein n=1 Tax=Phytoactinopolyspora endophytica TaxID=1642495 RepID=UPI0013EBB5B2